MAAGVPLLLPADGSRRMSPVWARNITKRCFTQKAHLLLCWAVQNEDVYYGAQALNIKDRDGSAAIRYVLETYPFPIEQEARQLLGV